MMHYYNSVNSECDRRELGFSGSVDLKKAFDTVDKKFLIQKLE